MGWQSGPIFKFKINGLEAYPNSNSSEVLVMNVANLPGYYYSVNDGKFWSVKSSVSPIKIIVPESTKK